MTELSSELKSVLWQMAKDGDFKDRNRTGNCYKMLVNRIRRILNKTEKEGFDSDQSLIDENFLHEKNLRRLVEEYGNLRHRSIRPLVVYANSVVNAFVDGVQSVDVKTDRMLYLHRRDIHLSIRFDSDLKPIERADTMVLSALWSAMGEDDGKAQEISLVDVCETLLQRRIRKTGTADPPMRALLSDVRNRVFKLMCKCGLMTGRLRMRLPEEDREDIQFGGQFVPLMIDLDREFVDAVRSCPSTAPDVIRCRPSLLKGISDMLGWRWQVPSAVFNYDHGTGGSRTWMHHLFIASLVMSRKSSGSVSRNALNQFGEISGRQLGFYMETLRKAGMVRSFTVDRKGVSWTRPESE